MARRQHGASMPQSPHATDLRLGAASAYVLEAS